MCIANHFFSSFRMTTKFLAYVIGFSARPTIASPPSTSDHLVKAARSGILRLFLPPPDR
jgi:hypothetical protein